jgi:hypothetical protein
VARPAAQPLVIAQQLADQPLARAQTPFQCGIILSAFSR